MTSAAPSSVPAVVGSPQGGCPIAWVTVLLPLAMPICSLAAEATGTADSPQVRVATGVLRGRRDGAVRVFKSVPYAQPPVGPLRFRQPRPAARWSGVLPADVFGPACIQS